MSWSIGHSVYRKDGLEKVTGRAKYTGDHSSKDMLHIKMVVSSYAHAKIKAINTTKALKVSGVRGIVLGQPFPLTGEEIKDRPPIAYDKVRYHGEPVAVVVADTAFQAQKAAELIEVTYEPLPVVNSPKNALLPGAPLVHENLAVYERIEHVYPEANTNIADRIKIRKGCMNEGWKASHEMVEASFSFSQSDHMAMETRCVIAEIRPDGCVVFTSATQSPYMIKHLMSDYFNLEDGKIIVKTPLVGGAFGGKVAVQLELIAYMASLAVGGRPVKLVNTREEDMITSPVHIGLDATIKLGATKDGQLTAAEILYMFDTGAYSDKGATISRAAAVTSTGPYHIDNVWCDSLCVYTNHPYVTAYRGFGHSELSFAFERAMDMLAKKLDMNPLELRMKNAILPGQTTPTQIRLNESTVGNLPNCIETLKQQMNWNEGQVIPINDRKVRAKGISCIWKTSTIDSDASSGVILVFDRDGSVNIESGVVEIGMGTKTVLAQMLAEKLKMDVNKIFVKMEIDTQSIPEHWKTVASRGTLMAGRALLKAADDAIVQMKDIASRVLMCSPDELEVGNERVYVKNEPDIYIKVKDICYGYKYPHGYAIGGQVIGRGQYMLRHLTHIDPKTGVGRPGPEYTVAAQGAEIEFDTRDYTYKILKAYSVIDAGIVLNRKLAKGQVMGAMEMGLNFGSSETFVFSEQGEVLNSRLRTYTPFRYGDHPEYVVSFIETPYIESAYGARGLGEHGLIGMPAALANALSVASGMELNRLPLTPEAIWRQKIGVNEY
ncbi:xanthine dehydrogenase family protein molybdopterin-binding subunit [Desulfosporosinus sp.]|uniref:xanthine dehydrogenase family protein molybdopterin-binding subunit n=1 Tax=Desulfosporosinus sp. TaxID=157907 RepID=UPI0025C695D8|nr:xanthine dehydrogenase family protein molybdopterin-binding subunit [Desulfosporosinus sp.]MBC2723471.1 xanthine dehydrogenase family protein molybdopterin-binding subunit [Desulfosporosinus sp.]MBC2725296.1 xanthine dehydrogenase family protein molybdopterin-binding subunit [Desulfosporosinus sp.]